MCMPISDKHSNALMNVCHEMNAPSPMWMAKYMLTVDISLKLPID